MSEFFLLLLQWLGFWFQNRHSFLCLQISKMLYFYENGFAFHFSDFHTYLKIIIL